MNQIKNDIISFKNPIVAFLLCGSMAVGLFNEPTSAVCCAILSVFLFLRFREKKVPFSFGFTTLTIALMCFSFLFVCIWAHDKYYAFLGFIKFLPLLLFYLNISCEKDFDAQKALIFVPYSAALMTVVSYVFSKFETLAYLFSVDGRIAGFFQYPNTFALFSLIGLIVIAFQKQMNVLYYCLSAVMIFGIFMSGSRTTFILFVLVVIALLFVSKNKKLKFIILAVSVVMVIVAVLLFLFSSKKGALGRFLSISLSSGTLNARLLYMKDALKYSLKHPFGIGYMSYYFTQGSFQTGLYTNRYVHNELLQLMLDIGWVPAIAAIVCAVRAFFSKQKPMMLKLILAVIAAHAMLDFDLQFLSIGMIALMCMQDNTSSTVLAFKPNTKKAFGALICLICCAGLYIGSSSAFFLLNQYKPAVRICKHNTMAQIELLNASKDGNERKEIASIILENNAYISNAYFALSDYYYNQGDLRSFVDNAWQSIQCNRFSNELYNLYASRLLIAAHYYEQQNNLKKIQFCTLKLVNLEKIMAIANQNTDSLARYLPEHESLQLDLSTKTEIGRLNTEYLAQNDNS